MTEIINHIRRVVFFLLPLCFFSFQAVAQGAGIAMHGEPKYPATFQHLDYVNPDAPKGGTITMGFPGSFSTLNPYSLSGSPVQGLDYYYDKLMRRVWDEPFTLYPLIAQSADIPPDRSSVTIHIDPRARFSDGSPITADDVIFSEKTLAKDGRPNMRHVYKQIASVTKIDPLTVKFTLTADRSRETAMIICMMPVLSQKWWQGRDFNQTILPPPVSSGPYKIESVDPGRRIVYARDRNYWAAGLPVNRGQYNFDRIIWDYYRDDSIELEAFKAGAIGLRREFDAGKWATGYDVPAVKDGRIAMEATKEGRPAQVSSLIFNSRRAPFDDIRVRKALSQLLDSGWINRNFFYGKYKRIESYFPNSTLAASGPPAAGELALLDPWRKDLPSGVFGPAWQAPEINNEDEQRQRLKLADGLLKQAGWIVRDGRRVRADNPNRALTFEIIVNTPDDEKIALQFENNLTRIGIPITIRYLDTAEFSRRLHDYDYDMMVGYWQNSLSPGSEQMADWSCAARNAPGSFNYAGVCSPAIDALAGGIANAVSQQDLETDVHALDRALTWGWYIIPLFYSGEDDVASWNRYAHPAPPLYGFTFEAWWAKQSSAPPNSH
jgi:ABC-type oligopeptide transport system substrate-binding subunit